MQLQGKALRVTIYIGENDRYQGKPLHMALLQFLKREGAAGGTVLQGIAGFGAHSRIHTASIVTLSQDLPLRLEWVDQPDVVERLLPQIQQMVDDGLITVETVKVVQYAPGRRPDPLALPVHDVMQTEVAAVLPAASMAEVVRMLLEKGYRSVPVVESDGRLVGIITDGDLLRRANMSARLDLQLEMPAQLKQQLADLQQRQETAAGMMTQPVVTIKADDSLRVAISRMVKHGLKRLPVVDAQFHLVGWISRVDVLRAVAYHQHAPTITETPAQGSTIAELMIRDVPTVGPQASLAEIVRALERQQQRRVVVVDAGSHVLGIITDGDLIRRSKLARQPGLLARLRGLIIGKDATPPTPVLSSDETAADLMTAPAMTITLDASLTQALHLMLEHQIKRLPVVDADGRLMGLLGRASLLRGLLQQEG